MLAKTEVNYGTQISLETLIALRSNSYQRMSPQKKRTIGTLIGQNLTKIRGRGIEFDCTREYQPGDDIRRMAWRVTARNAKPHIKVYQEERERPVWLVVDLSPSMFFGTRKCFKSVKAIEQATIIGWHALINSQRVGACIATNKEVNVFLPQAKERDYLVILKKLAMHSTMQPEYTAENRFEVLLQTIQHHCRAGHVIYLLSDFSNLNETNKRNLMLMAHNTYVNLIHIYDPLEAEAPPPQTYKVTDGKTQLTFNMANKRTRALYQTQFQTKMNQLQQFSRSHGINFMSLRTDQEAFSIS